MAGMGVRRNHDCMRNGNTDSTFFRYTFIK